MASKLLFLSLLPTALTQTPTLTLPLYGFDPTQSLAASIISTSPNATTLLLDCIPSPSDPEACAGFAYSRTLVTGPSTYLLEVHELDLTSTQDCQTTATSIAVCDEYATSGDSFHYDGVATYPLALMPSFSIPVTGGAAKLGMVEATTTTGSGMPAETEATTTSSSMETATMTSEAESETSTGAAAARGVGNEVGVIAAVGGLACLWL